MSKFSGALRSRIAKKTDYRIKLINEIIIGIQVIKMCTWEIPLEKLIQMSRSSELADIEISSVILGILCSTIFFERTALLVTVASIVLIGNHLDSVTVFSVTQCFTILQLPVALQFPLAMAFLAEVIVTIQRVGSFLMLEEKEPSPAAKTNEGCIETDVVSAYWNPTTTALKDLTFNFRPGGLYAIVGHVGSGKTALLQVIFKLHLLCVKFYLFFTSCKN